MSNTNYEVIVVGAGLAGLSAANLLHEKGLHFKVIEASSRPGGKVKSVKRDDSERSFELGAQFINTDMEEMVKWIKRAGLELCETKIPPRPAEMIYPGKKEISEAIDQHEEQFEEIKVQIDKQDERLSDLYDRLSLSHDEKQVVTSIYKELINIDPQEVSARAVLDLTYRFPSEQDDLTHQVWNPLADLVHFMEKELADHIMYQEPIVEIQETQSGYKLVSGENSYNANAVIMAVPPAVASRITYSSSLEKCYRRALNSYKNGAIIKTTWVYDHPFWHDYEVEGQNRGIMDVVYTDPQGVTVSDSSKEGGEHRLTMFIGANTAEELANERRDQQMETALSWLEDVFGKEALTFKDAEQSVWVKDEYCGGGYGAGIKYGELPNAAEVLRTPSGRFAFASSELSEQFPYFMEGAIRAGQAAVSRTLGE
ncbi:FAD-dependent oxidoreductase [Salipaludibacillus sp. CUR1]|uniref:flavin monoamine oxidase family protein n=1 Tax=Salipaludibacillus sp. CUR1 TaxID=2820003 RepID=UPI001E5FFBDD|nr:FAD-dependent oxidoreductase [Salipaludibacillus sp. CUR1]MCE7792893.1 FAD-dependent oxidoreductase [Salipaludibacillus sp. CUR1]